MNILILYAHPKKEGSFTAALCDAFLKGIKKTSHTVDIIDLYREDFNPVLSESDLEGEKDLEVIKYQELLKKADAIVIFAPIWWYRLPAILEGWFDRVITSGFAYKYVKNILGISRPMGLLPIKKAFVFLSYGGPKWYYNLILWNLPWRRLKVGVLKFCGIKKTTHIPFYRAPFVSDEKRKECLKEVEKMAKALS